MTASHSTAADGRVLTPLVRRRWRLVLLTRLLAAGVVLAIAASDSDLGPNEGLLIVALSLSVIPWHLLLVGLTYRAQAVPWYTTFVDALILASASTLAGPQFWPLVLVAVPSSIAIEAAVAGRAWATAAAVWSSIVMAWAGAINSVPHLVPFIVGVTFMSLTAAMIVGQLTGEHRAELERQRTLLDEVPALVWESYGHGANFVQGRIGTLLGYDEQQGQQLPGLGALLHPEDLDVFSSANELLTHGSNIQPPASTSIVREFRLRHADGSWIWLRDVVTSKLQADGTTTLRGISTDITGEREALDAASHLEALMDNISTPLAVIELDSGLATLQLISASAAAPVLHLDDPELMAVARRAHDIGEKVIGLEQGYEVWPIGGRRLALAAPEPVQHIAAPRSLDTLTSLPDRTALRHRLDAILKSDPDARLALLVMDLDQFKEVNDTLGHAQGDQLLRSVANRVLEVSNDTDLVCRLGGDEFALLLIDDGPERARLVAADLVTAIGHPVVLDGVHIQSGVSIGAAYSPDHGTESDILLQHADVAMYQAKSAGESYRLYDQNDDRFTVRRLTLLGELPRALRNDELVVHYQPKIDLRTSSVIVAEALVRWQHPEHGMIAPDEFIELAEVSGLVRELTRQVIDKAVSQLREWDDVGAHLKVAVNLSVRDFTDASLPAMVERCLAENEIDPSRLMLEITESEVMDDVILAKGVLEKLSALGIKSSIDDFGTGYSSLAYLRRLPIDEIKIDRSFVGTMAVNQSDTVIVRSIIELGHNLDLDVVAEGVEDEWTLDALRSLGCDQAQGYFFSRPVPPEEIPGYIFDHAETITRV